MGLITEKIENDFETKIKPDAKQRAERVKDTVDFVKDLNRDMIKRNVNEREFSDEEKTDSMYNSIAHGIANEELYTEERLRIAELNSQIVDIRVEEATITNQIASLNKLLYELTSIKNELNEERLQIEKDVIAKASKTIEEE